MAKGQSGLASFLLLQRLTQHPGLRALSVREETHSSAHLTDKHAQSPACRSHPEWGRAKGGPCSP